MDLVTNCVVVWLAVTAYVPVRRAAPIVLWTAVCA